MNPQPHHRANNMGEGVELVDPQRRPRFHHAEDGERIILQGFTPVLDLAEALLQICHLAAHRVQFLLQPYEQGS